jgi:D-threo-aldose 1-dehydrogenase
MAATAGMRAASKTRRIDRVGLEVTRLGFGGAAIAHLYQEVPHADAIECLKEAQASGISFFDTAPLYGHGLSEHLIGEAFRDLQRDGLVLQTKVGRVLEPAARVDGGLFARVLPFKPRYDYSRDGALRSLEDSLQRLGMSQVDLLLVHAADPTVHGVEGFKSVYREVMDSTYPTLAALKRDGTVRGIGFGINCARTGQTFAEALEPDVILMSGRYTLLDQSAAEGFLDACVLHRVSVVIGSPFNSGILAANEPASARYDYGEAASEVVRRVERIQKVAQRYELDLRSLALQFPLYHPSVVSVIPGMRSAGELRQNLAAMEHIIPDDLWLELKFAGFIRQDVPTSRP